MKTLGMELLEARRTLGLTDCNCGSDTRTDEELAILDALGIEHFGYCEKQQAENEVSRLEKLIADRLSASNEATSVAHDSFAVDVAREYLNKYRYSPNPRDFALNEVLEQAQLREESSFFIDIAKLILNQYDTLTAEWRITK